MKKIIYVIGVNFCVLIGALLIIEGGARLIFEKNALSPLFSDETLRTRERPFIHPHATRGFALIPGFSNGIYTVNAKGFRSNGPRTEVMDGQRVILALGESTTFGWQVRDNETYPAYLNGLFSPEDKVCVINGGVPSYTSSQVRVTLEENLADGSIEPDLILICILWNDIWYSTIKNWHPDILIYQKLPDWLASAAQYSRFVWAWVMGFSTREKDKNVFNESALVQYGQNIEKMIRLCQQKNVPVAFVMPPFDADHMPESGLNEFHVVYDKSFFIQTAMKYVDRLKAIAEKYNVPVMAHGLDLRFLNQKELFLDALHPTARGNMMMAKDIFTVLQDKNIIPFMP